MAQNNEYKQVVCVAGDECFFGTMLPASSDKPARFRADEFEDRKRLSQPTVTLGADGELKLTVLGDTAYGIPGVCKVRYIDVDEILKGEHLTPDAARTWTLKHKKAIAYLVVGDDEFRLLAHDLVVHDDMAEFTSSGRKMNVVMKNGEWWMGAVSGVRMVPFDPQSDPKRTAERKKAAETVEAEMSVVF